ncbi:MAG TPA: TetR/AcrR family transcriptional regulator [Caulobacteraceae bacterium]|jgi:AcrR family transcriptional regulator|nr:TetR/AcrR family transcriptional regulator [Caulobacteraceae bacterium]
MGEARANPKREARPAAKLAEPQGGLDVKLNPKLDARRDARREAILEVARQVFFEEGYAAASMSSIAARLGGSKGTLYNYFRSKDALFEAYIEAACGQWRAWIFDLPNGDEAVAAADLHAVLCDLGERFLGHLVTDSSIRLLQLVVAEAQRAPELARTFYDAGPAPGVTRVAEFLEAAKAAGRIDPPDCRMAAQQFLSLCRGHLYFRYSLNLIPRPTPKEIRAEIERAVTLFLRGVEANA